ncbi:MAG: hypothetical protein LIO96_11815 [Lachnospiraceae bacterium]|nr:hypothetical protein [Lachnospiraceae bacterium]
MEEPEEESYRQYYFMSVCRGWVKSFEQENGRSPKACVVNMGCQMNAQSGNPRGR